jgi:hypothetical protein
MRKGYVGEYLIKNKLIKKYGKDNVIKVAIGGAEDFIVVKKGRLVEIVEVKETIKNKYNPSYREKKQFKRIKKFAKEHGIPAKLCIVYRRGSGKKSKIEVINL